MKICNECLGWHSYATTTPAMSLSIQCLCSLLPADWCCSVLNWLNNVQNLRNHYTSQTPARQLIRISWMVVYLCDFLHIYTTCSWSNQAKQSPCTKKWDQWFDISMFSNCSGFCVQGVVPSLMQAAVLIIDFLTCRSCLESPRTSSSLRDGSPVCPGAPMQERRGELFF